MVQFAMMATSLLGGAGGLSPQLMAMAKNIMPQGMPMGGAVQSLLKQGNVGSLISSLLGHVLKPATLISPQVAKELASAKKFGYSVLNKFFHHHHHHHHVHGHRHHHGARPVQDPAQKQKADALHGQLKSILDNKNLSPEEKIVLLAGVVSDSLDHEMDKLMKQWGGQLERTVHQGDPSDPKSKGSDAASGAAGTAGAAPGAPGAGGSQAKGTDKKDLFSYLQLRIQQLQSKKKQLLTTASNVLSSSNQAAQQVISNIRG